MYTQLFLSLSYKQRFALYGIYFFKLPPYTLVGFNLTTHSSSLLGGRQRRHHAFT
jgi:hypothetical protein